MKTYPITRRSHVIIIVVTIILLAIVGSVLLLVNSSPLLLFASCAGVIWFGTLVAGRKLVIQGNTLVYYPNMWARIFSWLRQPVSIDHITHVSYSVITVYPYKFINSVQDYRILKKYVISTPTSTISFPQFFFARYTLRQLFCNLKEQNANIMFDKHTQKILQGKLTDVNYLEYDVQV